jgi:hypothetical protein
VIKFAAHRAQAGFDVPQTLAIGQLREGHSQILIPAGEAFRVVFPAVTVHALVEFLVRQMLEQLRKHRAASVHPALLPLRPVPPSTVYLAFSISNCFRGKTHLSRCK